MALEWPWSPPTDASIVFRYAESRNTRLVCGYHSRRFCGHIGILTQLRCLWRLVIADNPKQRGYRILLDCYGTLKTGCQQKLITHEGVHFILMLIQNDEAIVDGINVDPAIYTTAEDAYGNVAVSSLKRA